MFTLRHRLAACFFPKYSRFFDQVNRNAMVMKWYSNHDTVPRFPDQTSYFEYIAREFLKEEAVDYLEFGVFRGDSIRKWTTINSHPDSRFVGFDTFEGLPEEWNSRIGRGAFDVGGALPQIADERVKFIKGLFQDTVPEFLRSFSPISRLVIHNDSDLYSSTLYVLTMMEHLFKSGTIIMFDEFSSALHEFRAWQDFQSAYQRPVRPVGMTDDRAARVAFIFE
jgi:Macrocin-O-methyltransferase (TylF)